MNTDKHEGLLPLDVIEEIEALNTDRQINPFTIAARIQYTTANDKAVNRGRRRDCL